MPHHLQINQNKYPDNKSSFFKEETGNLHDPEAEANIKSQYNLHSIPHMMESDIAED
jgi:hypothetical protein